jgi:hypothetical protein
MAVSFTTFFPPYSSGSILYYFIYGCMFCMFLFNFVNCVFLLLFIILLVYVFLSLLCSVLGILSHCVVLCTVFA